VEITFSTADDRLRYTVEPGSASLTPRQRLDTALRLLDMLGPAPLSQDLKGAFRDMQRSGDLSFGAWIGGRHDLADDRYKVYVEIPDTSAEGDGWPERVAALLENNPHPRLPDRAANMRMIGYSPASEEWEFYFRVNSLAPYHLPAVLAPARLASKAEEVLGYITDAYGYSLGERLPGESVGISYTVPARKAGQNAGQSVTLFFFARVFWGGDEHIRRQFGRYATALGWDDSRYQRITEPLSSRRSWKTYHGILGITVTPGGRMALSIGVRPHDASQVGQEERDR